MPRGGPRPGAGRPKGSGAKGKKSAAAKAETKKAKPKGGKVTVLPPDPATEDVLVGEVLPATRNPLESMLHVMIAWRSPPRLTCTGRWASRGKKPRKTRLRRKLAAGAASHPRRRPAGM
jgi:hypothetical protein